MLMMFYSEKSRAIVLFKELASEKRIKLVIVLYPYMRLEIVGYLTKKVNARRSPPIFAPDEPAYSTLCKQG